MVIVHYIYTLDRKSGGVGSYMQLLAKELGKISELHIVTQQSDDQLSVENCTIHYISPFNLYSWGRKMKKEWLSLLKIIHPDVVHINGCWKPDMAYAGLWAKEAGYSLIISTHGMLEPWDVKKNYWTRKLPALLLYQKKAIQRADYLHATSRNEYNNLHKLRYNRKIIIIPNGIAIENINIKTSWEHKKQLLYLALLRKNKGADILIEAVRQLKSLLDGYKVIIAGTPGEGEENYVAYLHELIGRYNLEDIVSMPGGIYNDEKWILYQESDLFILPTLNENFGIVIAESLLSGTPVITCKGAPWSMLESEHCGWWVERSVDDIVLAIKHGIQKSADELEQMGRRGRLFVEEHFCSKKIAKDFVKMYNLLN